MCLTGFQYRDQANTGCAIQAAMSTFGTISGYVSFFFSLSLVRRGEFLRRNRPHSHALQHHLDYVYPLSSVELRYCESFTTLRPKSTDTNQSLARLSPLILVRLSLSLSPKEPMGICLRPSLVVLISSDTRPLSLTLLFQVSAGQSKHGETKPAAPS